MKTYFLKRKKKRIKYKKNALGCGLLQIFLGSLRVKSVKVNGYTLSESTLTIKHLQALVAHLDAPSDWRPGGRGFNLRQGRQQSFVEIDHDFLWSCSPFR